MARAYASLLRNVPYMAYTAAGTLLFGALFTYISVSPFVLMTEFGASSIQFGLIFGSIAVLIVMSGALNMRLLPSRGPETLLLAGLGAHSLAGLALCLLSFTQAGMWAFVAALAACIGSLGLVFGNLAAPTMAKAGPRAGIAAAFMGAAQYAGGFATALRRVSSSRSGAVIATRCGRTLRRAI